MPVKANFINLKTKRCFMLVKRIGKLILILASCIFITCEIGLGKNVNVDTPVIKIPKDPGGVSAPGSFLSGKENIILLDAFMPSQSFKINSLYLTMEFKDKQGKEKKETIAGYLDKNTGKWAVNIDTIALDMEDGKITAWATAVDSTGKKTTSTDIVYYIKNTPPQIQLTIPSINKDFDDPNLNKRLENETIYIGMELIGVAYDNLGIAKGFPKIMIWPKGAYLNTEKIPTDDRYNDWHEMPVPGRDDGLTMTKFSWPMYELVKDENFPGGYRLPNENDENSPVYLRTGEYQFKIWIQDIRGKNNFYPYNPNDYIQINYQAAEIPIISITNILQYYNGADDFSVRFNLTSSSNLSKIEAYIRDKDDGNHGLNLHYEGNSYFKLVNQNGNTYNYELKIPHDTVKKDWIASKDGNLFIFLSAEDSNKRTSPQFYRNFIFDTESVKVTFDRPVNIAFPKFKGKLKDGSYEIYYPDVKQGPKWITGESQIGALCTDAFGIKEIYYHIGKLGDDNNLSDEQREVIYNNADWKNTNLHTPSPLVSDNYGGKWSGTVYAWTYTCNFNNFLNYKNLIQSEMELGFENTETHLRYFIPFYIKAIDNAGNVSVAHYKLCVDPDLDIPMVSISHPSNAGLAPGEYPLAGGEIRLSGLANDNNAVHTVQIRIKKYENNGSFKYYIPAGTAPFYPNSSFPVFADEKDKDGWFKANIIGEGNIVNWYYNINADGGLDPQGSDTQAHAEIQVRAIDTKDIINRIKPDKAGPVSILNVLFSSGVPTISNPVIKKANFKDTAYYDSIRVSGKFTITTVLRDDDGIRLIKARFNGAQYTKIVDNGSTLTGLPSGWSITEQTYNSSLKKYERTLSITADTADKASFPSLGYGKTGNLILDIQIIDMNLNMYTSNASFTIGADNFYPRAIIETHSRASGSSFSIHGTAKDYNDFSGSIQGLDRMLVFFEKAQITGTGEARVVKGTGVFINQHGQDWSALAPRVIYPDVRDTTIADGYGGADGPNVKNFDNFPALNAVNKGNLGDVWESPHAMVIDRQEFGENTDIDKDGTFGEVWDGETDIEWMARFNTEISEFSDGPLLIHYILMDKAGNATRYTKEIFIENNKPLITQINLGTDWDGNGKVDPYINNTSSGEFLKEKHTIGLTTAASSKINFAPEFRVRNNRFTLMLDTTGGNGAKTYKVSYVTENPVLVLASALERGKVYTIAEHGGIDWVKYGAPNNNLNTTFVATGRYTGITSAKAISYNEYRTKTGTIGTGNASLSAVNFTEADFGLEQNGLIPDSIKDSNGVINSANQNKRLFIINVYDNAVPLRPAEDQNAHAVLIAVDIDNIDSKKPEIKIAPFYWNSISDNSLYENSKENGHIELESDLLKTKFFASGSGLMDTDPKVSGIISVRGSAYDNNTISKILFSFNGTHNAGNILQEGAVFDIKNSAWKTSGDLSKGESWQFLITNAQYDSQGHHVEWQLDIDTAKIFINAAQLDCILKVSAADSRENKPNTSDEENVQTTINKKTSFYRMDIVPYIKKIQASGRTEGALRDINIRSANGKYSIRQSDKNTIAIEGFNLNPDGAKGGVRILSSHYNENLYEPFSNPPSAANGVIPLNIKSADKDYCKIEIENKDSLKSGYLAIWTNGIGTLNNINNNDAKGNFKTITSGSNSANGYNEENMPNREADRYTTKNIRLTDDRYIQFYRVVDTNLSNCGYPVMIMNDNNPVFGYIKDNGGPSSAAGIQAGTGAGSLNPTYAAVQRRETDGVTGAEIYTEYLIKGSMWDGMGMTRDNSGRYLHATTFARDQSTFHLIYDRFNELYTPATGLGWGTGVSFGTGGLSFAHTPGNNAFSLETVNYKGSLNIFRYQYPKLYARGDSNSQEGAAYYLLYFDESEKELAFRNFKIINNKSAVPPASTSNPSVNWVHLGSIGNDMKGNSYNYNHTNMRGYDGSGFSNISGVPQNQYDNAQSLEARKRAAQNASKFFDFTVTDDNIVVIVYYDQSLLRLVMRYSEKEVKGEAPVQDITWIDSSINFPLNVGMYVSMTSDGNALHLSANDSNNGDLMYIYVPDYRKKDYRAAAVDKFGTTGNWTDIKLKPGTSGASSVPYIAYFNMADIGSRDGNKIAYLNQGIGNNPLDSVNGIPSGADANGFTTGKWEYASIPAITAPQGGSSKFQKVNLGFRTDHTPIIGYLSTNIEFAYPIGE